MARDWIVWNWSRMADTLASHLLLLKRVEAQQQTVK